MEKNLKKYVKNLRIREKMLVRGSIYLTLAGGIISAASDLRDVSGMVLIYIGVYCATSSQIYKKTADQFIEIDRQYVKKRETDIK